jgi:hypothetical protein
MLDGPRADAMDSMDAPFGVWCLHVRRSPDDPGLSRVGRMNVAFELPPDSKLCVD